MGQGLGGVRVVNAIQYHPVLNSGVLKLVLDNVSKYSQGWKKRRGNQLC